MTGTSTLTLILVLVVLLLIPYPIQPFYQPLPSGHPWCTGSKTIFPTGNKRLFWMDMIPSNIQHNLLYPFFPTDLPFRDSVFFIFFYFGRSATSAIFDCNLFVFVQQTCLKEKYRAQVLASDTHAHIILHCRTGSSAGGSLTWRSVLDSSLVLY